jgi:hypothetical protein
MHWPEVFIWDHIFFFKQCVWKTGFFCPYTKTIQYKLSKTISMFNVLYSLRWGKKECWKSTFAFNCSFFAGWRQLRTLERPSRAYSNRQVSSLFDNMRRTTLSLILTYLQVSDANDCLQKMLPDDKQPEMMQQVRLHRCQTSILRARLHMTPNESYIWCLRVT